MCARAKSQETIVTNFTCEFLIQWWANKISLQTDKCVITQLSTVFFCIYANLPRFLPWWQYVSLTQAKEKLSFFFYTRLLMLFYTLGVSIYRLNILFYFSSLQTSAASIVFLLDIYIISLYSSHILLTFLSLNLVKRTLIEL